MICTFNAPNGEASNLYSEVKDAYGSLAAEATYAFVRTPEFKERYPEALFSYQGEPEFGWLLTNNLIRNFADPTPLESKVYQDFTRLADIFEEYVPNLYLREDTELNASAEIGYDENNVPYIAFNPNRIAADSIFHEFGHLYVDLLGYTNPLIQAGIDQLRGTTLWNNIQRLYPDLNDEQLGKEVLTTAIGNQTLLLQGDNKIVFIINQILRKIAELLGLEIDIAKKLASELITGNVEKKLRGKLSLYRQQRRFELVNDAFITKKSFLIKARNSLIKKINDFYSHLSAAEKAKDISYTKLSTFKQMLDNAIESNEDIGILNFIKNTYELATSLNARLDQIVDGTWRDARTGRTEVTAEDILNIQNYNSLFGLATELIELVETDPSLKLRISMLKLDNALQDIAAKHIKIANLSKQLGIKIGSKLLRKSGAGINKEEALQRQKLEREYNQTNKEERNAANTPGKKRRFAEKRTKWVNEQLPKSEDTSYYDYILQQSNRDISYLDRLFVDADKLNDELINTVSEILDKVDYETMTAVNKEYDALNAVFLDYSKKHPQGDQFEKYKDLLEDEVIYKDGKIVKTGKKNTKLASKYYSIFIAEHNKAWEKYHELGNSLGYKSKEAKAEYKKVLVWRNANMVNKGTKADPVWIANDNWLNPAYDAIKDDPMYKYLTNSLIEADLNLPTAAKLVRSRYGVNSFELPSIKRRGLEKVYRDGLFSTIKEKWDAFWTKSAEDDTAYGTTVVVDTLNDALLVTTNEAGVEQNSIPIHFRHTISKEDQSYDLPSIILLNYHMALNYKNKTNVRFDIELIRTLAAERDVVKTDVGFLRGLKYKLDRVLYRKTADKESDKPGEQIPLTEKGEFSNAFAALDSMIEHRLYGISTLSSVQVNKIVNAIAGYTGHTLLMLNYLSAGANLATGMMYNMFRVSPRFYTRDNFAKAHAKYVANIHTIVGDIGKRVPTSKVNLLIRKFNAFGDWEAVAKQFVNDTRLKQMADLGTMHFMNHSAEHMIQSILMLSVLDNIKVKNKDGLYITASGETTDDINKAMSLDEAYDVIDGDLVLKPGVDSSSFQDSINDSESFSKDTEFLVSRMIRELNSQIQGQYSPQKKAEIQRHWYGVLVMLLRKWMPAGLKYRWRGVESMFKDKDNLLEDEIFYDKALNEIQEGYYVTTGRILTTLIRHGKQIKWEIVKQEWSELTDEEKANVIRTVKEFVTVVTLLAIGSMFKEMGDDDEGNVGYYLIAFYALRLQREMMTFVNPAEFSSTIRTPTVAIAMLDRGIALLWQMLHPFERYETGARDGELKIIKKLQDFVPIAKQIDRELVEAVNWMYSKRIR
jgi:hypothetical protein